MQDNLRMQIKIIKAIYGDLYTYKDIANYLEININSFYNWLSASYNLGESKENKLKGFVNDILY